MKHSFIKQSVLTLFVGVIVAGCVGQTVFAAVKKQPVKQLSTLAAKKIKKFTSSKDFSKYITRAGSVVTSPQDAVSPRAFSADKMVFAAPSTSTQASGSAEQGSVGAAPNFSTTNVQVVGIDEPDSVKTDGQNIYISQENFYPYYLGVGTDSAPAASSPTPTEVSGGASKMIVERMPIAPPFYQQPQSLSTVISAVPADSMSKLSEVTRGGKLLVKDNTLYVSNYEGVFAYDVTDKKNPREMWKMTYNGSSLVAARMYTNSLLLVVQQYVNSDSCVLKPIKLKDIDVQVKCTDMYRPVTESTDASTYHVFTLNPKTGEIKKSLSLVGAGYLSTVYASNDNLYIAYGQSTDQLQSVVDFIQTSAKNFVGSDGIAKIRKVMGYDIENSSKLLEVQNVLAKKLSGLSQEDKLTKTNELNDLLKKYVDAKARTIERTNIVKVSLENLVMEAVTSVPGRPLNQFALDEWNGSLRVATTVRPSMYLASGDVYIYANGTSFSDLYTFDSKLNQIGSVQNLGQTESIYSVRFVESRGYVVTFRQTDPFYVFDLSDAKNPKKTGELKLPGFSSYLHPLKSNLILGVGQEDGKVKLSLFDVSNSYNPIELDTYHLNEYWTEVANDHHAFMSDSGRNMFFIPGGQGGYIFNYTDNKLALYFSVPDTGMSRALYIGDAYYFVANTTITSYNVHTKKKLGSIEFRTYKDVAPTPIPGPCTPENPCPLSK